MRLRSFVVCALLVGVGGLPLIAPPCVHSAYAAKKKKKKHGIRDDADDDAGPKRTIKQEAGLAPKKDVNVDQSIGKTKDLRPAAAGAEGKKPGLSQDDFEQTNVEALMDEKLDEEIQLANQLLEVESSCDDSPKTRFHLADLNWEKSKRAFFKSQDFNTPDADKARYTDEMKSLQNTTVDLYQKILDECPTYAELPKILFYYGRALMELDRAKEGAELFNRIIKEYPDTEWVAQAWFMVGEYWFNTGNDANKALNAYNKATQYPQSPIYGFAVYKQGWCYINVAEWPMALQKFNDVVRISEDPKQPIDDKVRGSLRKEGIKDYVRAYAHVGEAKEAMAKFRTVGNAKEVAQMMEHLGNYYIDQGAHVQVIAVYRDLIKAYPKSTRLPIFQGRVVDAMSRTGSPKDTVRETKLLTDYFLALRKRIHDKSLTPEEEASVQKDVNEAEDIAENTIRRLATEYHKEAKKLRGAAQDKEYEFALELYRHYLDVFPEPKPGADVNYVFFMRFYYAEILYKLEHFLDAAKQYDMVVEMNPHPTDPKEKDIVLSAAEDAVRSYDELVQDLDRQHPPDLSGTQPKKIPEVKEQLISACKRYIDYVGDTGDKIVEIRYKMARIYYTYNHFEQAAPAFNDIVTNHPESNVACYAANLALDIYNGKKDYRALKEATHSYVENKRLACGDADRKNFAKLEEQSTFFLIKTDFEEKKKYIAAGNAYMQFYRDYPASEYADDAVYNAAVNYDLGNRLDKANEVRRFLVDKLPNSPLVPETLYNIAQSYERIVDFENAAKYLELFAKRYPQDKRSKDAIYNSALYRATLHDFAGAREGRQNFIKLYPNDNDVHNVAFSICEDTELEAKLMEEDAKANKKLNEMDHAITKKWSDAHDCYFNYIKNGKYSAADPDLVCHAQFRRGEIMRLKTKYDKGYEDQKKFLFKAWPNWKKNGLEKMPRCATAIAELQFRDMAWLTKKYNDLTIAELNPQAKKQFDASLKAKITARDKLVEDYKAVAALGVAQWGLAALYSIGEAYRDSIDKLVNAPVPNRIPGYKLTAEDKQLLRQQLHDMAQPIEELAVEAYKICVNKANELGLYNKWSIRALDQLQKLRPADYPLVVESMEPLTFQEPLKVQRTGLIIADGEDLKPIKVKLKEAPPAGAAPAATAPAPNVPPPAGASPTPAAAPPAPAQPNNDVPAPAEDKP